MYRSCDKYIIDMKIFLAVAVIVCVASVQSVLEPNTNIDDLLADKSKADQLVACALEKGPCTDYENKWKSQVRRIIDTHCGHCSENEKNNVVKFLKYLIERRPSDWTEFVRIHNVSPSEKEHLEDIAKRGV
ncbi:ejaculatory bulb-specific protein 3-like [Aethina tumida]|uniref:ejaculatory bulb-specific protein 3-like n=1 Tax=Aethina tumida TaxID=116153 RepID=UPI0021476A32|nr:ejaculatory bulb-specific protein 3-like [Aethina tumida]